MRRHSSNFSDKMEYRITHSTIYDYFQPVSLCHNIAMLLPRNTEGQFCKETHISIDPQPDLLQSYTDFFGNTVLYFAIQQEHKRLSVTVQSVLEKNAPAFQQIPSDIAWEAVRTLLQEPGAANIEVRQYCYETGFTGSTKEIQDYARVSFTAGRPMYSAVKELMQRIYTDFDFTQGFTTVATPLKDVMQARKGVCQDFAHLAIACICSMGLPARYMSGYIETMPPAGQAKLYGVDASHAWFAVYIPGSGWLEFDPTNNMIPNEQHICIGWGRDYADVTPLKGVILSSGPHELKVSVDVRRTNS